MEDCSRSRGILKEKNDNTMVENGSVQQKLTTSLTKKLNQENEHIKCNDENNILKDNYNLTDENISTDNIKIPNSSLPDIVNVLPTITVIESSKQISKEDKITSSNLDVTDQRCKINIPSGPSSSISSDDELFVECEEYSVTDKSKQSLSIEQNDINVPICRNEENLSVNLKESDSNSSNTTNWKSVLSSVCSQNVEDLENSQLDLDISPQNLNSCLDTTTKTILDNNIENQECIIDNNLNLMKKNENEVVDQNILTISSIEITHPNIMETENRILDTTLEKLPVCNDNIDEILSEHLCNLQISDFSNSLNSTVIENKLSKTIDTNLDTPGPKIEPNDKLEGVTSINENQAENTYNLTTDTEMVELSPMKQLTSDDNQNENSIPLLEKSEVFENNALISKNSQSKPIDDLENEIKIHDLNVTVAVEEIPPILFKVEHDNYNKIHTIDSQELKKTTNLSSSQELSQSKLTENMENEFKPQKLNMTVTVKEDLNGTDDIYDKSYQELNKTTNLSTSEDVSQSKLTENVENKFKHENLNMTLSLKEELNGTDDIHDQIYEELNKTTNLSTSENASHSKLIENMDNKFKPEKLNMTLSVKEELNGTDDIHDQTNQELNKTTNLSTSENVSNSKLTENMENESKPEKLNMTVTVKEELNDKTYQKLNETNDILSQFGIAENIMSDKNVFQLNNVNSSVAKRIDNDKLVLALPKKFSNADNVMPNVNLNLTVDITETNDSKTTVPHQSPITLESINNIEMAKNQDNPQNLLKIIQNTETESINELNTTCNINSGQNSPNLNFVDSSNQGQLNLTFAASTEALNSTINVPIAKNINLPIISSPVDSEKIIELQQDEENQNYEDEFQSNGMILNERDFDFLLTKGNNNNNTQIQRSSLLLKFDPFLGKPQLALQYHQDEEQNLQQHKYNQESGPVTSVTSSFQSQLSPAAEEEEYLDTVAKSSSLDIVNTENLIVTATENSYSTDQLVAIKTEPLDEFSNTMSIDVVRDMKTENNFISAEHDINSTDVKYDIKMEDLEKKIQNEVLKRTEEIGKKLKEVEQREEALLRRITEKDKTTAKMGSVIEAYEKAIAEMIAEKEEITHNYERKLAEIKSERDLNYQHLASLESTFADLHLKYERSKQITAKLKANEEESCAARKKFSENLRLQEQRYEKMKNHAMQQLEIANNKLEFLTKNHSSELTKLKALLKKEEISKGSIAEQLQQKTRENEELVKICDELINGQGS